MLRFMLNSSLRFLSFQHAPAVKAFEVLIPASFSTICVTQVKQAEESVIDQPKDATEVLRKWGCADNDLVRIFSRRPSLRNADTTHLQYNLSLLSRLGIGAPDLVRIINCRPRFLNCQIHHCFDEKLSYLMSLFESNEMLQRAIVRNPSLLTYSYHNTIKPVMELYEDLGVKKGDLILMLIYRPTILVRTSFDDEKLEYIRKTGISKESKMYKYVVTLIGVSRLETIRGKVANLGKYGFSDDEIFGLFGRAPLILTLSIDKVQRNMTFILGTMKLEAKTVLDYPFLLSINLDTHLKPRVLLARKIQDMDRKLQIPLPTLLTALRMTEKRFVNSFINCHTKEVADELMEFYLKAKAVKRLAESAKKCIIKSFPF